MEITFELHPKFEDELKKYSKKHPTAIIDHRHLCNLLSKQFHPEHPQTVLTPKNLHRVDRVGSSALIYKANMVIQGLSRGQCPRVYFWVETTTIWFLCMDSHIRNYDDSELKELAKRRVSEINPNIRL